MYFTSYAAGQMQVHTYMLHIFYTGCTEIRSV